MWFFTQLWIVHFHRLFMRNIGYTYKLTVIVNHIILPKYTKFALWAISKYGLSFVQLETCFFSISISIWITLGPHSNYNWFQFQQIPQLSLTCFTFNWNNVQKEIKLLLSTVFIYVVCFQLLLFLKKGEYQAILRWIMD